MSTGTIHVSVSIDNEIDPIEFNFLNEKLNWENLVTLIQSTTDSIETPVILYFKKDDIIESLENQEQLEELLTKGDIKGLRLYGEKELVNENVFVLPGNAFVRLGELIDQHKDIVSSSHRIARWVGILASFIAQDTTDYDFDYEFEVLEQLIERKTNKRNRRSQKQQQSTDEIVKIIDEDEDQEKNVGEKDPREAFFGARGPFGGHRGGRGGFFGFGGRGGHHARGGRHGHHHPREFMFGPAGPCHGRGEFFGGRGGFFGGRHGMHHPDFAQEFGHPGPFGGKHGDFGEKHFGGHHGRGRHGGRFGHHHNPFDFAGVQQGPLREDKTSDAEEFEGRHPGPLGEEFGFFGRPHRHGGPFGRKHRGGKHGFGYSFDGENFGGCGKKKHRRHRHPYGRGGRGSSSEESSSEDEIRDIRKHLLKKHLKHGKHFERHFENHFHFAA